VKVPAKPKRKGINPFTGQEQWFAAKPASTKVKVRPMKKLKDAAKAKSDNGRVEALSSARPCTSPDRAQRPQTPFSSRFQLAIATRWCSA
jgi:hypothetical protein